MTRDPVRTAIQAGVCLLLYAIVAYLFSPLFGWAGGYLVGLTLGGLLAALFANMLSLRIFESLELSSLGLAFNGASAHNAMLGLAGGSAAALLVLGLPLLTQMARLAPAVEPGANWRTVMFVPVLLLAGALGEEMLFHGFAFQVLLRQFGAYAVILPVGALFGILHGGNPHSSQIGIANTAGFGVLFGLAFLRSHDLWLPMGMHFGWNVTLPLLGANLSGITIKPTGITILWNAGPLWSGGDYGPEASILTSAVLLVLLLYVWKIPVRKQHAPLVDSVPDSVAPPPS